MNNKQLKHWREEVMQISTQEAANLLDKHINSYLNYERGFRYGKSKEHIPTEIPRDTELACAALALGFTGYDGTRLD